jgi:hypothetical protein
LQGGRSSGERADQYRFIDEIDADKPLIGR